MRYASIGWDGVRSCIDENVLTPGLHRRAMAFASEFRKKHAKDPNAYPLHWLIRNIILHEFHITAVNPIGPGTRAYAIQQAEILTEANALDAKDDFI